MVFTNERETRQVHLSTHSCLFDHLGVLQHSRKYEFVPVSHFLSCYAAALSLSVLPPFIIRFFLPWPFSFFVLLCISVCVPCYKLDICPCEHAFIFLLKKAKMQAVRAKLQAWILINYDICVILQSVWNEISLATQSINHPEFGV